MPTEIPAKIGPSEFQKLSEYDRQDVEGLAAELIRRRMEALALFEPLPFQEKYLASIKPEAAVVAGNQVGKSLVGFVEVARAATDQDPHHKYPPKNGKIVCVGQDDSHIGTTIHHYLFESGAFQIIRDEETGEWRTFKPWVAADWARFSETIEAPPLIPDRFIKKFSWEVRSKNIFSQVTLTTGWTIYARSSKADPIQGMCANLTHIDEDLDRQEWYDELNARLLMARSKFGYTGLFRWSALPHAKNDALINLMTRAEEKDPDVDVFVATVFDNPFMDAKTRDSKIRAWKSAGEDVYRMRALGEVTTDTVRMYPTFDKYTHTAVRPETPSEQKIFKILRENNGQIPHNWCRYTWTDPGYTIGATAFFAVPPPELGNFIVQYDELYITSCTANKWAVAMKEKCHDQVIEAFGIDHHGSRSHEAGTGITIAQQYSDALKDQGLASVATGTSLKPGSDDVAGRTGLVRQWLAIRRDGTPKYLIVVDRCPNTLKEFQHYKKQQKRVGGVNVTIDKPLERRNHLMNTIEYGAADGCPYKKQPKPKPVVTRYDVLGSYMSKLRNRSSSMRRKNHITLGPQGAQS
jgi:hypothetical protein